MDWSSSSNPEVGNTLGVHVHCDGDMTVRYCTNMLFGLEGRETCLKIEVEDRHVVKLLRTSGIQILQALRAACCIVKLSAKAP